MSLVTKFLLLLGLLISVRGASGSIGDSCVSDSSCEHGLVCDTDLGGFCARVPQNSKAYGESCYGDDDCAWDVAYLYCVNDGTNPATCGFNEKVNHGYACFENDNCDTSYYNLTCFKGEESDPYKSCLIVPGTVGYHGQCMGNADCVSPMTCNGYCYFSYGSVQENGICYENDDCDTSSKPLSCFVPQGESGPVKKCMASCYSECADPTGSQCAYCCFRSKDTFGCPSTGCLKTQTYADCCPVSSPTFNWYLCRGYCYSTGDSTGDVCKCVNSWSFENCCSETVPDVLEGWCVDGCEEDCSLCAAKGRDICPLYGMTCDAVENECYEPGQGGISDNCGKDEDAACGALLYCNTTYHRCYGDGSDGAVCNSWDGGNRMCAGNSICAQNKDDLRCRARGDGTNNAFCNDMNDNSCINNLFCDDYTGKCRPPGSGASGNPCNYNDSPCGPDLACDNEVCRAAGNGSLGAKCGANKGGSTGYFEEADAICNAGLVCYNRVCRAKGNGSAGSICGGFGDDQCVESLVCGNTFNSNYQMCLLPGDGSIGSSCYGGDDVPCTLPAICDNNIYICRARGNGGSGAPCGQISPDGDAQCTGSTPVCDSSTRTCRAVSGGVFGNSCGTGQDTPCNSGLACDQETYKCRVAGDGSAGSRCYGDGDANCTSANPYCDDYRGCRAYGDGSSGALCNGYNDVKCGAANPICDFTTHTCRSGGNGAEGAHCGSQSDLSCSGSLFCDPILSVCRGWGDGSLNANCGGTADTTCKSSNPVCDSVTFKCRGGGTGVAGGSCGSQGDQACKSLLLCSNHKCVGTGVSGSHCSGEGDLSCSTGLYCGSDSTCGSTPCTTGCPLNSACTTKAGCAASLACDKSLLVCRAAGDGSNGANCSSDGDATCITGFVCGSNNRCGNAGSTPCASQCPKDTACTETAQCAAGLICNSVCSEQSSGLSVFIPSVMILLLLSLLL